MKKLLLLLAIGLLPLNAYCDKVVAGPNGSIRVPDSAADIRQREIDEANWLIEKERLKQNELSPTLSDKFRQLLQAYGPQLQDSTVDEVIELEALGNRYLAYGQVKRWKEKIEEYEPSAQSDKELVSQLKQLILNEFGE